MFSTKVKVMNSSGRLIDPFNLEDEDFNINVVALTLSRICRFWGQTTEFYSVAQHCLALESIFDNYNIELKRWAMAHEIFEGLTGMDVPSPIKHSPHMTDYVAAEEKCLQQAAKIYGLSTPFPQEIKIADKRMMVTEALRFMSSENYDWRQIAEPFKISVIKAPLSSEKAQEAFLEKWLELFGDKTSRLKAPRSLIDELSVKVERILY